MTSFCLLKQQQNIKHQNNNNNNNHNKLNIKDNKQQQLQQSFQAQKNSIKTNNELTNQNIIIYNNNKPRSTSYTINRKQHIEINSTDENHNEMNTIDSKYPQNNNNNNINNIKIQQNNNSTKHKRRQTLSLAITGQEFVEKKLQISDLDEQQKMEILKRLCNHKAIKTDQDNLLIYEIIKNNPYILYLKQNKNEAFILNKIIPNMKIIHKKYNDVIYEQDTQSKGFYVILKGECEGRMRNNITGQNRIIQDKYIIGTEFGNMEMLDQKQRIQTIMCKRETWLMYFDQNIQRQYFQQIQKQQLEYLIDIMSSFVCFANYGRRNLLNFLPFFTFQKYQLNQKVYQIGQQTDFIYFIVNGDFKVYQKLTFNNDLTLDQMLQIPSRFITDEKDKYSRQIEVSVLNEGQIFGEEEIIGNESIRKQEIVCTSSHAQLLLLHKDDYEFKFNNDPYFSELFKNLTMSKRQYRDQRLKEIEKLTKNILNSPDNTSFNNHNQLEKKVKAKLEDKLLDLQKKGLIKQKCESLISSQINQFQDVFTRSNSPSSPVGNNRKQNSTPNSPTIQYSRKRQIVNEGRKSPQLITKKNTQEIQLFESFSNSIVLDNNTNMNKTLYETKLKLYSLNTVNDQDKNIPSQDLIDQQNNNVSNDGNNRMTKKIYKEIIPSCLIEKGEDKQLNQIKSLKNSCYETPSQQNTTRQRSQLNNDRIQSSSEQNNYNNNKSQQNTWISSNRDISTESNIINNFNNSNGFKNIKYKQTTLEKNDFYGINNNEQNKKNMININNIRCETSPSRQRSKINDPINNIKVQIESRQYSQRLNSDHSHRISNNQNNNNIPLYTTNNNINTLTNLNTYTNMSQLQSYMLLPSQIYQVQSSIPSIQDTFSSKFQSIFYNHKINLQNSPNKLDSNSNNNTNEFINNNNNNNFYEQDSKELNQQIQQQSYENTIIRSPQDEPTRIYDPTGVNKYLRRIFYGKAKKKSNNNHHHSYSSQNDYHSNYNQQLQTQQDEDQYIVTEDGCWQVQSNQKQQQYDQSRGQSISPSRMRINKDRRNGSLEDKIVRQIKQVRKENQMKVNFEQLMQRVDKKSLKVHLYKKNLIKEIGDKEKYNSYIKPQGIKQETLCFEYVNQRLNSVSNGVQGSGSNNNYDSGINNNNVSYEKNNINYVDKYDEMVQKEYQKFQTQNLEAFESILNDDEQINLLSDNIISNNNNNQNQYQSQNNNTINNNGSQFGNNQLHNVRGSSYNKKRKVLRIVNDPESKKQKIIAYNNNNHNNSMMKNNNDFIQTNNENLQQTINNNDKDNDDLSTNKFNNKQQQNNNIYNQSMTYLDEPYQLNELLKTKDIIPNCFIPHSKKNHSSQYNSNKKNKTDKNNNDFNNQQTKIQYLGEQLLLQQSPNKLIQLNQ